MAWQSFGNSQDYPASHDPLPIDVCNVLFRLQALHLYLETPSYLIDGFLDGLGFKRTSVSGLESAHEFHLASSNEERSP
eukprot:956931-Pleurochrysis_carterae.AAC.1